MNPRCDCEGGGGYWHHHSFGGTYPCEGQYCIQCQDPSRLERAVNRPNNETR